jgi:hypothetical protein
LLARALEEQRVSDILAGRPWINVSVIDTDVAPRDEPTARGEYGVNRRRDQIQMWISLRVTRPNGPQVTTQPRTVVTGVPCLVVGEGPDPPPVVGPEVRCDELAGNPTDQNRKANGVPYETLRSQATEANSYCRNAVAQYPNEPRYRYQLGRALQSIDKAGAFAQHERAAQMGYPAAYDNLGVLLFRKGADLGDPESIMSLAQMIKEGHASPRPGETLLELYRRAHRLGHPGAAAPIDEISKRQAAPGIIDNIFRWR